MSNTVDGFRISPQQRRLFYLQSSQGGQAFVSWVLARWPGIPHRDALAAAIAEVVSQYEVLRTRFEYQEGIGYPFQTVAELPHRGGFSLEDGDTGDAFDANDPSCVLEHLAGVLGDPDRPVLYGRILHQGGVPHLLMAARSTILDRASLRLVVSRVCAIARGGEAQSGEDEPIQYIDFSEWCHSRPEENDGKPTENYPSSRDLKRWCTQLYLRERTAGFRPGAIALPLDPDLQYAIGAFARRHAVSAPAILLGAWTLLMSRWSGHDTPLIGYVSDGRQRTDVKGVVGVLTGSIPIAVQVPEELNFAGFAEALDARIRSLEDAIYSFRWEQITDSEAEGIAVYPPICFEADLAAPTIVRAAPEIEEVNHYSCAERFDLKLLVTSKASSLYPELHYNRESCPAANVESIGQALLALLAACVALPTRQLREISGGAALQPLVGATRAVSHRGPAVSLCDLWQKTVDKCAGSLAVVAADGSLTFADLDRRAAALARRLAAEGVKPNDCVATLVGRTATAAVAIWGILKAGAAYVPMDPGSPPARIERVLEDAQITVVVSDRHSSFRPQRSGCRVLAIDHSDDPSRDESDWLAPIIAADSPAYVIYTSGSTGTPKGVMVSHSNLVNYLNGLWERVEGLRGCSAALVSSLSMDLGNTIFFSSLCSGGTVHLLPYATCTDPDGFADYMAKHAIESLKIVPSHLASLLAAAEPRRILPSKYLICGGEKFSWELHEQIQQCRPTCEIFNHYGPTETTIGAVMGKVPPRTTTDSRSVPLGEPLPNYRIYLVGTDGAGVHRGFPGEICIAGPGLATRYVGGGPLRSTLDDGRVEMYRTGDIARVGVDGSIEYLRRNDTQVKISGYRVELGEIEARLREIPSVKRAVVQALDLGRGELELCAFVVSASKPAGGDLRTSLASSLPGYMIPATVVELDAIPLNANGKIDVRMLRECAVNAGQLAPIDEPETAEQRKLRDLWRSVLGTERVGVSTDFFSLGGTSLKAIGLVAAINRELGVRMSLADIFDYRTIRAQARYIAGLGAVPHDRVERVNDRDWYPVSSAQQRMYVVGQMRSGSTAYNMPVGVEIRGEVDRQELERAFLELIGRHEILRTAIVEQEGGLAQRIDPAPGFVLEYSEDHDTAAAVFLERLVRPFDLSRPPLVRAHLIKRNRDCCFLLFDRHHVASDNVSSQIFINDLFALYQRREMLPVTLRYRDYAVWEQNYLQSPAYLADLEHWRKRLADLPPDQPLPLDRPRPRVPTFAGAFETFELTTAQLALVDQSCADAECTRFAALMAAYRMSLHCLCAQADVVLGTDVANREQDGMQNVMGILVNQLAIRTEIRPDRTVREVMESVARAIVEALRHQQLPFDHLVTELQPNRDTSLQPIFKNKFVLTEEPGEPLQFAGWRVSPLETPNFMTKFDTLMVINAAPQKIQGSIQYSRELFNRSTVLTWIESFLDMVDLMFANLDRSVGELQEARHGRHAERLTARSESVARAKKNLLQKNLSAAR